MYTKCFVVAFFFTSLLIHLKLSFESLRLLFVKNIVISNEYIHMTLLAMLWPSSSICLEHFLSFIDGIREKAESRFKTFDEHLNLVNSINLLTKAESKDIYTSQTQIHSFIFN